MKIERLDPTTGRFVHIAAPDAPIRIVPIPDVGRVAI